MGTAITRVPRGLQGLLGTQAFGQNPGELGSVVNPTLDMKCFYDYALQRFHVEASVNITTQEGIDAAETVPEGEMWIVKQAGIGLHYTGTTLGDTINTFISIKKLEDSDGPNTRIPLAAFGEYTPKTVSQIADTMFTDNLQQPVILKPGTDIELWHTDTQVTTGAFLAIFSLYFTRLRF